MDIEQVSPDRDGRPRAARWPDRLRARWGARGALAAVSVAFGAVALLLVPPTLALGWDEIVYVSRWDAFGPAAPFSAPRSRGTPLLAAPVAAVTDSVVVLRCWLTALASLALYAGFRPWVGQVASGPAVPVAAAAYGSLWFTLFYASSAMPNHYVAMAAVAAVGCVRRELHLWLAAAVAVAGLMRASDALWLAAPLLLASWRRPRTVAAVLAGLAAGVGPWVVEAERRFGGVAERLAEASDIQGGTGLTFSLFAHATALDGPLLCRPCDGDSLAWPMLGWWLLLPPLVALGLYAARRQVGLLVVTAGFMAFTYIFLIDYAAPRFLLPVYALLALPAVLGLERYTSRLSAPGAAALLALLATGQLALQLTVLRAHADIQAEARADWERVAGVLRDEGVEPPCVLGGSQAIPVAHTLGCATTGTSPSAPDAVVLREEDPPSRARDWQLTDVPGTYNPGWRVAVPRP
ncbi:hypothetical protein [Streptomyces sp. RFCAC02]|uniref:hypothetical protein n=1 Tax=Streptomyces sp. RFCAC02 TaxID=2499143 RepID=UPI001F0FA6FA|nr:hypothetical protein [Streptomyces sp. RFCAC02]